jgi:hypothetical protein
MVALEPGWNQPPDGLVDDDVGLPHATSGADVAVTP